MKQIGQPLFMRSVVVGIWVVDATQIPFSIIRIILIRYTVTTKNALLRHIHFTISN